MRCGVAGFGGGGAFKMPPSPPPRPVPPATPNPPSAPPARSGASSLMIATVFGITLGATIDCVGIIFGRITLTGAAAGGGGGGGGGGATRNVLNNCLGSASV